jgi:4'-phosphopantetheinyl transferase
MVSFSHAGTIVVAAVSGALPVGVDLEPLDGPRDGVAEVALSATEQAELATRPPGEHGQLLTRWWVRKEAVLKARGRGLEEDPARVEVTPPWEAPVVVVHPEIQLVDLDLGNHVGAVATIGTATMRGPIEHPW